MKRFCCGLWLSRANKISQLAVLSLAQAVDEDYILRAPKRTVPLPKFDDLGRRDLADSRQHHQLISRRRVEVDASSLVAGRRLICVGGGGGGRCGVLSNLLLVRSAREDCGKNKRANGGYDALFDYGLHYHLAEGFVSSLCRRR